MKTKPDLITRIKASIPEGETRTVRELADKLRLSMKKIIDEVDGSHAGLDLIVGFRTYNGVGGLPRRDWQIEHYQA
ncbi:hypothetical protein [Rhizobium sp. MHM7A]|uniref:hypothetical protein n=1 Tax=Rhizobium sp. MHM7A TaxID=2583233 RepID=UPI00110687E7|nr:hypothetical protein [Rhizobium sp. MHM7A]TLX16544.1 hypothetical protein FFR93_04190 [Rhizobium sp. MHM7A]